MKKAKLIRTLLLILAAYLALPVFLLLTNPETLPLPLLVLPIIIVFVACFVTALLLLKLFRPNMKKPKQRVIAVLSAILPTLLVILQSIQQLSARDVFIVFGLWLLLVWYLQKIDFV